MAKLPLGSGTRKARPKRHDWGEIKARYVTGQESTRQIASIYGIALSSVCARCSAEGWVQAREEYRRSVGADAVRESRARDAHRVAQQLEAVREAADRLSAHALEAISDPQQYHRHLVQESDKGKIRTVERVYSKIDSRAMMETAKSLSELSKTLRAIYGIPTWLEEQQLQQARERLELERAKAQVGREGEESGGVLVLAAVEEQQEAADDGGEA